MGDVKVFDKTRAVLSKSLADSLPGENQEAKLSFMKVKLGNVYPEVEIRDVTMAGSASGSQSVKRLELCDSWENMIQIEAQLGDWLKSTWNADSKLSLGDTGKFCEPTLSLTLLSKSESANRPMLVDPRKSSPTVKTAAADINMSLFEVDLDSENPCQVVPKKRGRGRPPKSASRKTEDINMANNTASVDANRPRPIASVPTSELVKIKVEPVKGNMIDTETVPKKRGRGRPPGSGKKTEPKVKENIRSSSSEQRIRIIPERTIITTRSKTQPELSATPYHKADKSIKSAERSKTKLQSDTEEDETVTPRRKKRKYEIKGKKLSISKFKDDTDENCETKNGMSDKMPPVIKNVSGSGTEEDAKEHVDEGNSLDEFKKHEDVANVQVSSGDSHEVQHDTFEEDIGLPVELYNPNTADIICRDVPESMKEFVTKDKQKYKCEKCSYQTFTYRYIRVHVQRSHMERKYLCDVESCGRKFGLRKDLASHQAIHSKKFKCPKCGLCFAKSYLLFQHERNKHILDKKGGRPVGSKNKKPKFHPFQLHRCEKCEYHTMKQRNLVAHYQRLHGEKQFDCSMCDKKFGLKKDLNQHIRFHTERFTCEKCGKVLKCKYALELHDKRIHLKLPLKPQKSYQCDECGKVCRSKTDYRVHKNKEHLNIRPFKCTECGMAFFAKGNLKTHMLIHSDHFSFACNVCGKKFRQRPGLRVHMFSHMENLERPYKCSVCNKAFTQRGALTRHERIHTGDRPYICQLCSSAFNDYSILRRHVLGIHKLDDQDLVRRTVTKAIEVAKKMEEERIQEGMPHGSDSPPLGLPDTRVIDEQQRLLAREHRTKYLAKKRAEQSNEGTTTTTTLSVNPSVTKTIKVEPGSYGSGLVNVEMQLSSTGNELGVDPKAMITLVPHEVMKAEPRQSLLQPSVAASSISEIAYASAQAGTSLLTTNILDQGGIQFVQEDMMPASSGVEVSSCPHEMQAGIQQQVLTIDDMAALGQGQEMEHIIVITNMVDEQTPDLSTILSNYQQQQMMDGSVQHVNNQQQVVAMSYEQAASLLGAQAASVLESLGPQNQAIQDMQQ